MQTKKAKKKSSSVAFIKYKKEKKNNSMDAHKEHDLLHI